MIDVDLECGVLVGSAPYSGFYPNPVQPIRLELKIHTLVRH